MGWRYTHLVGVGGIGSGMFFRLRGNRTLGRSESRGGTILPRRDFCKLHIIAHYVGALTGSGREGLTVVPVGKVGDDPPGAALLEQMRAAGMDVRFVTVEAGSATLFSVCFTYQDGDGGNITTEDSASSRITPGDVDRALDALGDVRAGAALAAPEAPLQTRLHLLRRASERGWFRAAAATTGEVAAAMDMGLFAAAELVSLNRDEAAAVAGISPGAAPGEIARAAGERLARANPRLALCVTAGAEGSFGWKDGRLEHTPAPPVPVVNTAGAGDATLAGLIVAQAGGLPFVLPDRPARKRLADAPLETALDLAALLAGLSVMSEDTINFAADTGSLLTLGRDLGADVSPLAGALEAGPGGPSHLNA